MHLPVLCSLRCGRCHATRSLGDVVVDKVLLFQVANYEWLDLRSELGHDGLVVIGHVAVELLDVLKLQDKLVVPLRTRGPLVMGARAACARLMGSACLGLADQARRAPDALGLGRRVEELVEDVVKSNSVLVVLDLRPQQNERQAEVQRC